MYIDQTARKIAVQSIYWVFVTYADLPLMACQLLEPIISISEKSGPKIVRKKRVPPLIHVIHVLMKYP